MGTEISALNLRRKAPEAYRALAALTRAGVVGGGLAELVKVRASLLNGCGYCVHRHSAVARRSGETEERLEALRRDYRFVSDRALEACGTYGLESVSLVAVKAP